MVVFPLPAGPRETRSKVYDDLGNEIPPSEHKGRHANGLCGHPTCSVTPAPFWYLLGGCFVCEGCAAELNRRVLAINGPDVLPPCAAMRGIDGK